MKLLPLLEEIQLTEYQRQKTKFVVEDFYSIARIEKATKDDPEYVKRKYNWKQWVRKHEGLRYLCSKCDHKATQPNDLKKHISAVHEKNSTIYVCGQESILGLCQRRFSSKSHMNKHRQSNKHRYL